MLISFDEIGTGWVKVEMHLVLKSQEMFMVFIYRIYKKENRIDTLLPSAGCAWQKKIK